VYVYAYVSVYVSVFVIVFACRCMHMFIYGGVEGREFIRICTHTNDR